MHVSMTVPTDDLARVRTIYAELERVGYDRVFSFSPSQQGTPSACSWAPRSPSRSRAHR
jgi:hypothetical protein